MNSLYARETLREEIEDFFGDWCVFMTLIYLRTGDVQGAIAAYEKVQEYITADKKKMILCKVKDGCAEEVYHAFEVAVNK
ncbi:MAG: hypothetical protein J6A94_02160 [Lachnospiraceae bacterium]|nr:hypothetical protein [Lachnospiraceae bacterium]